MTIQRPSMKRTSNRDFCAEVGKMHAENIDQGFLSRLGPGFLKLLYESIDEDPNSNLIIEFSSDGKIIGFVSGGNGMGGVYRKMLRQWKRLLWYLIPVVLNPLSMYRLAETAIFTIWGNGRKQYPNAELFSIVVNMDERNSGVASRLYEALSACFRQRGIASFKIIVGENLTMAARFYQKMGAVPCGRIELHKGSFSHVFIQELVVSGPMNTSVVDNCATLS